MGMTIREYIEKKNKILRGITGLTLVPEDQIINFNKRDTENFKSHLVYCLAHYLENGTNLYNDEICPYCHKYQSCDDCVMNKKNNRCRNHDSTYLKIINALRNSNLITDFYGLSGMGDLVKEFIEGE